MRKRKDPRRQDFSPACLDFGPIVFYLPRHFGFCYGVENAIEISYKALEQNPHKRIYLVSQIIHNQQVNNDLERKGIRFILDTKGKQLIPWDEITSEDIVIVPAFGTTMETEKILHDIGVPVKQYDTTCPFVEKVWNKANKLGEQGYTVIIHGKPEHEETRATFSHSAKHAPSIIVCNMAEAKLLGECIAGKYTSEEFYTLFEGRLSPHFSFTTHLHKLSVVNQTTMLAGSTQAIGDYFRMLMVEKYGKEHIKEHFADTRDTLCYATTNNQDATHKLLETDADMALVVGGYNSSNTLQIATLCSQKFTTYFIHSEDEIKTRNEIHHFDFNNKKKRVSHDFIPAKETVKIVLTSGASCPDTTVDQVMLKMLQFFRAPVLVDELLNKLDKFYQLP